MTVSQETEVRFGPLERRGLLAGLTAAQVALLGIALIVVVAASYAGGPSTVAAVAPVWGMLIAFALLRVGGRPALERLPVAVGWLLRRATRTSTTLLRPGPTLPGAPVAVPGVGRLRISELGSSGPAALQLGRSDVCTVVAEIHGRGFLLEGSDTQDRRVAAWSRLLASFCETPGVVGAQVLHRTVVDVGDAANVHAWWTSRASSAAGWATRIVYELDADAAAAPRLQTLLAVAVRPGRSLGQRGGDKVDSTVRALAEAIESAELELRSWLNSRQIHRLLREAYDPVGAARATIQPDPAAPHPSEPTGTGGPMGVAEAWSHVRTDSAFHATYWVSDWPRSQTHSGFLRPLLLAPGARVFTLLAQPVPADKALREIRRARAEQLADAATRARIGRVEDERARAATAELDRREADLVAGHGDLRFTGLLAISANSLEELEDACASTETAAAQAGCDLRRLVGRQVQAYAAAALPLVRGIR